MKIWTETSNITEYYIWISQTASAQLKNNTVISINASDITDISQFGIKCREWFESRYSDIDQYSFYLICNEVVKDPKSRVEQYKKCWKKLSEIINIESFELGYEYLIETEGFQYYSGIARFALDEIGVALNIIDIRQRQFLLLMSKENLLGDAKQQEEIIRNLVRFDKHQYIDFEYFFEVCIKMGFVALRYGKVSGDAELAVIECNDT